MLLVEVTFFVLIRMSDDSSEKNEAFSLFFFLPFPSIVTITSREDSLQQMNRSTLVSWFSLLDKKYPRYFYLVFDSGRHTKKMLLAIAAFDPKFFFHLALTTLHFAFPSIIFPTYCRIQRTARRAAIARLIAHTNNHMARDSNYR